MKNLILSLICFLPLADQAQATNRGFFQRFRARQRVVQRVERVRVVERVVVPQAIYAAPQAFFVTPSVAGRTISGAYVAPQHVQSFKVQQFNGGGCAAFFKGH